MGNRAWSNETAASNDKKERKTKYRMPLTLQQADQNQDHFWGTEYGGRVEHNTDTHMKMKQEQTGLKKLTQMHHLYYCFLGHHQKSSSATR